MRLVTMTFVLWLVLLATSASIADASETTLQQTRKKPAPVTLSAKPIGCNGNRCTIELTLKIHREFEIHANPVSKDKAPFLPTKVTISTPDGESVPAKLNYPTGTKRTSVLGDYFIYDGTVKFTASFTSSKRPLVATAIPIGYNREKYY